MLTPISKTTISNIVRQFDFTHSEAGNCAYRAVIGHHVLRRLGLEPRFVVGAMLYRAGKHRRRDTLRFCLPNNLGGYYQGFLIAHCWNEVGDEIVDFSAGDWQRESVSIYEHSPDPVDLALGPVEWIATPPEFIWQDAHSLKSAWRPIGQPTVGNLWYGGWHRDAMPPDFLAELRAVVDYVSDFIEFELAAMLFGA